MNSLSDFLQWVDEEYLDHENYGEPEIAQLIIDHEAVITTPALLEFIDNIDDDTPDTHIWLAFAFAGLMGDERLLPLLQSWSVFGARAEFMRADDSYRTAVEFATWGLNRLDKHWYSYLCWLETLYNWESLPLKQRSKPKLKPAPKPKAQPEYEQLSLF